MSVQDSGVSGHGFASHEDSEESVGSDVDLSAPSPEWPGLKVMLEKLLQLHVIIIHSQM